jgi:hypothetical protein
LFVTDSFDLVTVSNERVTNSFVLVTDSFDLVTLSNKAVTKSLPLVTHSIDLVTCSLPVVTYGNVKTDIKTQFLVLALYEIT